MTPFNTFNCIYLQGGIMHELARKVTLMRVGGLARPPSLGRLAAAPPARRPSLFCAAALGGARARLVACPHGGGGSPPHSLHFIAVEPVGEVWPARPLSGTSPPHPARADHRYFARPHWEAPARGS